MIVYQAHLKLDTIIPIDGMESFKPLFISIMSLAIIEINQIVGLVSVVASAGYACLKLYREIKRK